MSGKARLYSGDSTYMLQVPDLHLTRATMAAARDLR